MIYIPSCFLLAGFYYLTFRNSPKHAQMLLLVVVICIGISYIPPRETFVLPALALGIIGVFIVIIQSRKAREEKLSLWFAEHGFKQVNYQPADKLFIAPVNGESHYYPYKSTLVVNQETISYILAIRHTLSLSGKTTTVTVDGSFYFNENIDVARLEQKFNAAKSATSHTNLWKSHLRFFDLKDCQIFKPAMGGIVVSWRLPDTIDGYTDRYEWVKNVLQH
ncbi:hypothetical protein [Spirosoma areae]